MSTDAYPVAGKGSYSVKYRPILFSGPMVRAILEGRKTQTRRLFTGVDAANIKFFGCEENGNSDAVVWFADGWCGPGWYVHCGEHPEEGSHKLSSLYEVGQRLWVRETWAELDGRYSPVPLAYRADVEWKGEGFWKWRPSIFMPRWASRITLEVTGVRVERLQDITEKDARAEGVQLGEPVPCRFIVDGKDKGVGVIHDYTYRGAFCRMWNDINGKRATWDSNPPVKVTEFRRIKP